MNKSFLTENEMNYINKKFIFQKSAKVADGNVYEYRTNRGYDELYLTIVKYNGGFILRFGILPADVIEIKYNTSLDYMDRVELVKVIKQQLSFVNKNFI